SKIAIFGGTTEQQQQGIITRLQHGFVSKGTEIFRKGEAASHIYIIASGGVDLIIPDSEAPIVKKKISVGECFGHVALISMQPHTVSAIASEETEMIVLSKRALIDLKHEDLELFALLVLNIARELARRLRFTDEMLFHYAHTRDQSLISDLSNAFGF